MSIKKGVRFGMLRVSQIKTVARVTVICDCGKGFIVHGDDLRSGVRTSCDGCKSQTITAAQIEKGELELLGKRIAAHLEKMHAYEAKAFAKAGTELRKADDHWNTISQLLAEAKKKCDGDGFRAFQSKYCPDLGRSRIYELLAIGSGKKTLEETRAGTRKRMVKNRRKVSVTSDVTDKPPKVQPPMTAQERAIYAATKERAHDLGVELSRHGREYDMTFPGTEDDPQGHTVRFSNLDAVTFKLDRLIPGAKGMTLADFTLLLQILLRTTGETKLEHFIGTEIKVDELRRLAAFFSDIADLKSSPSTSVQVSETETRH